MTEEDARFEDARAAPLRLRGFDAEDLRVISTLTQDSIFPGNEVSWRPKQHRFALLLNRFRWEDREAALRRGRDFERVQSVLAVEDVTRVASQGIARNSDTIYSLLSLDWEAGADGSGRMVLTLSGDGAIALDAEALEVTLRDVTRPYRAPSRQAPDHSD
jgi:hypothetical protein